MLFVALVVVAATSLGIAFEHSTPRALPAAQLLLSVTLYGLLPLVTYTSFAHLQLSLGAGVGLALAYVGLALAGLLAWRIGTLLGLPRPALGAVVCSAILANTGNLGLPIVEALLGGGALAHAVAYDQVVSSPMLFTVGFAVGAAFNTRAGASGGVPMRAFLTRNPPLLAAIAGLLVPAAWAPHALVVASHAVVDVLVVLGFFAVGVYLSGERPDRAARLLELPDRRVVLAMACRFSANPLLLATVSAAGVGIPTAYLVQSLMPTGINTLIVGRAFGLDQGLIASIVVWSTITVLCVATVVSVA